MQEVLGAFRANMAWSAQELAHAQASGAVEAVADIAHRLKSAARSIGATRLGQICADIEEAATSSPRCNVLGALTTAFDSEVLAIHDFLDRRKDGHV